MKRSICPICNQFYEETTPANKMCDPCFLIRKKAMDYVRSHHLSSIAEVTLATGIPIKSLKKLIEHGDIHLTNN